MRDVRDLESWDAAGGVHSGAGVPERGDMLRAIACGNVRSSIQLLAWFS